MSNNSSPLSQRRAGDESSVGQELVEDGDEDYAEDMQTDDLEEDGEVYDDYNH